MNLDNTVGLAKTFNEGVGGFGVVGGSESEACYGSSGLIFELGSQITEFLSIGDTESLR